MSSFEFQYPWLLAPLALLPVYAFLRGRAGKLAALRFPSADIARAAGATARAAAGRLLLFLRLLTIALCIVALAGPRFANVKIDNQAFWSVTVQIAMRYGYTLDSSSYLPWDRRARIQLSPPIGARKINVSGPLTISPEMTRKQAKSSGRRMWRAAQTPRISFRLRPSTYSMAM